jgi:hypothetical protein
MPALVVEYWVNAGATVIITSPLTTVDTDLYDGVCGRTGLWHRSAHHAAPVAWRLAHH